MKKIILVLLITIGLFADCDMDVMYANSSAINAVDYAQKGNHKYALIEVNEAIMSTKQALDSCKEKISSHKMDELQKNLSSLYATREQIKKSMNIDAGSFNQDISNCKSGNAVAYYKLADKYFMGNEMNKDHSKALEYYRKSCDNGYPEGCNRLGLMYMMGQGGSKDYFKSAEYYKKGCDGNNASSCLYFGACYIDGTGVDKDKFKAMDFFNKACNLGNQIACKEYLKLMP